MSARDEIACRLWCSIPSRDDAHRAGVLREGLTADERKFLAFMVDTVQEVIWNGEGFTDADQTALDTFRALSQETS